MTSAEPPSPARLFDMAAAALSVVDSLNDVVVVVDDVGRIVYANPAMTRVLGWERADLLGESITMLIPERLHAAHHAGFERFLRTGELRLLGQPTRVPALGRGGTEHPMDLVLSSLVLPDGERVLAGTMRDLADRLDLERQSTLADHLLGVLTRDLTVPELVRDTIEALGRALEMPAAAFWAPAPGRLVLRCDAFWRETDRAEALEQASRSLELHPGEGLPGRVWLSRQPSWVARLADDPGFLRITPVLADGLSSALAFPVVVRQELLGVIELYTAGTTEPDQPLLRLMELTGRRLGEVLYATHLEEERRLLAERERSVAAAFRESLLPDVVPVIPEVQIGTAFSPGGEGVVGGDFYDVYPLTEMAGNRRWGFTVGDVCGTGPAAAAITSKVRYTARALMRAGLDLVAAGEHINTAMSVRKGRRFCTGIIGTIYVHDEHVAMRFVNAGHPPPVLRRSDGTVELLPSGGSLLGALPAVTLWEQSMELDPGETLVLYTDGVTEARDVDGGLLGEDGLLRLVADLDPADAGSMAAGLQEGVQRFTAGRLSDDVAILVLRRPDQPPA